LLLEVEQKTESSYANVLTTGSQWAAIWHMVWPLFLNMVLISLAAFCDTWVAGKISSTAQAAIGLAGQVGYLMIISAVALSTGTTAIMSRCWGARNFHDSVEAARHSFVIALVFGVGSAVAGLLLSAPLLHALGANSEVERIGSEFMTLFSLSMLPTTMIWVGNSVFRSMGDAKSPLLIGGLTTVLIISGELIFCIWPFHFGVTAIGASWLVSSLIGMLASWLLLRRTLVSPALNLGRVTLDSVQVWLKRLLSIGLPASIQDVGWVIGKFILFLIFTKTQNPTACQAAWGIGIRVEETCVVMPVFALHLAAATIIGQNLGAKQPERATKSAWYLTRLGILLGLIFGLVFFTQAKPMAEFMSTDPAVIQYTTQYFQVLSFSQVCFGTWFVLFGAMQGAGYTRIPMFLSLVCLVLIRLPLAYLFVVVMHLDALGCWLSPTVSQVAVTIGTLILFMRGTWKKQRV
jgi:putative MATE family efflux protein